MGELKTDFYALHPEMIRLIILEISDAKSFGNILLTSSVFSKSLIMSDDMKNIKKRFSKPQKYKDSLRFYETYFVLPNKNRHGKFKKFNWHFSHTGDKKITMKGKYDNGKKIGLWVEYYENGNLKLEVTYDNGLKHGSFKEWALDETLLQEGFYKNDKKEGEWKRRVGFIYEVSNWESGNLKGNWCVWHRKNGNIIGSCVY